MAFALIKTEGLDDTSRTRIQREAQAMGRLGSHPHIVTVFALGQEGDQPYMVTELMGGGDVEGLIEKGQERKPVLQALVPVCHICGDCQEWQPAWGIAPSMERVGQFTHSLQQPWMALSSGAI